MRTRTVHLLFILPLFLLTAVNGNSQTLYSSNSTPAGYGENPIEWFSISGTPDVSNIHGWWGATDWYYPIDNPPNGDTVWVTAYSSEKSRTYLSDLMLGVEYTLSFYMAELSTYADGAWTGGTFRVVLGDEAYLFPFTGGLDFGWSLQTITFTPTSPTMFLTFGYEVPVSHQWNVSVNSLAFACDTLDTYFSTTEVCIGDEVILDATSLNDGAITWDGGIVNGEPFMPPVGTTLYTASSDFEGDCNRSVEIIVYDYPDVEIIASATDICEGDSVIFTIEGADGGIYDWTPDVVIGYPYFPELGTSIIELSVTNGVCGESIETIEITVHEAPTVSALVDDSTICLGESVILTGEGAAIYTWNLGIVDGEPFTPLVAGTFTCVVEGTDTVSGCSSSDFITVTVLDSPTIIANADDDQVCEGDLVTLTGLGAGSLVWNLGVTNGIAFEPPLGSTIYTVVGTNENGCQDSASITIHVIHCDAISVGFILPNSICLDDCFSIQDTTVGEVTAWAWDFGPAFEPSSSPLQNPIICANSPGAYSITLTATDTDGETYTYEEEITVLEKPILEVSNDTIIKFQGIAELKANSYSPGNYIWTPSDLVNCYNCPITTAAPYSTQTYTIQLIDLNGCIASDSIVVMVNFNLSVGVPTAFSPNNDGHNDELLVKGEGIDSINFSVYNRYGQLVFETTDQELGWDGTFLNVDENPAVFTWVLHYKSQEGESHTTKGNTTLIR